jgi:serine/threonine protein kinase
MFAQHQEQIQSHLQARMQSQHNCWNRQSMAQKTIAFVESDLKHVLNQSPFLRHSQPGEHVGVFHRSEVILGPRLGNGGFSNVYAVAGFNLNPYYGNQLDQQQQQLRLRYQHAVATGEGRFAIKFLQEHLMNDTDKFQCAASDLAVDAAYMSTLNHPNILPVRGLSIDGLHAFADGRHDGYFIIMDRLEETLDDRMKRWKHQDVPLQEKMQYALQLAAALQYLHERRIVYRDLKPHNVGINSRGQVQLFDFGLCRELPEGNFEALYEMSGVGTRRYMATEIINTSRYNHKADVYAWAMVFWEMLYLDRPFPHYSIEEHKMMVCEAGERPPIPHGWPMEIRKLLGQSWTASIKHRFSMKEAGTVLQNYLNSLNMQAAPESPIAVSDRALLRMDDSFMRCHGLPRAPILQMSSTPSMEDLVNGHNMSVVSGDAAHQSVESAQQAYGTNGLDSSLLGMVGQGVEVISDYSSYAQGGGLPLRQVYSQGPQFRSIY